jgi:uncharacterized protein (DUF1501 family)
MHPTRRDCLRLGLGTSTLLACGSSVPAFLARSAAALAAEPKAVKGNVLVVVQLDGGNDGLNTIVPYKDDDYRKHRPKLQLAANSLLKIDDHLGLHPGLGGFARLLQAQQLAVVQSVGYPNPNRSHFESMAIWHAGHPQPRKSAAGWLARCLDARPAAQGGDVPALHVNDSKLPEALQGSQRSVPSLVNLEQFRRRLGVPASAGAAQQRAALDEISAQKRGEPGSLLDFVQRNTVLTYASSARLEGILNGRTAPAGYPGVHRLARRLQLIAQLIKAGLTTSIYYTQLGGFDTHANQLGTHDSLLRAVGQSLQAFLDDLHKSGEGQRVLVLVFSEFGRRLRENASAGTDHGTAAPVFLLGAPVKAGVHGPHPNLRDLDDGGDPKHAIDFRQVYATVLDEWLSCPSAKVLGEKFARLGVLRPAGRT